MSLSISPAFPYTLVTDRGFSSAAGTTGRSRNKSGALGPGSLRSLYLNPSTRAGLAAALSARAGQLSQAMDSLEFPESSAAGLFRTALVSDSQKAAAEAGSGAKEATYTLDISSLATRRTAKSIPLPSDETTGLDEGTHSFTLTVNGTARTLSITVDKSGPKPDTNRDVLQQIARAVRSADDRLDVSVSEDTRKTYSLLSDDLTEKISVLTVQAGETGDGVNFSLSDTTGSTIVEDHGLDRLVLAGGKAGYRLNQVPAASNSNTVTADNGRLTIQLLSKTAEPVTIRVESGLNPLRDKITGVVDRYNDTMEWLDQNTRTINPALKSEIQDEAEALSRTLKSIGLTVRDSGQIEVTTVRLEDALRSSVGAVERALTGPDGFFTRVSAGLSRVLSSGAGQYAVGKQTQTTFTVDVYA